MGRRCYVLLRFRHHVPIRCRGNVPLRRLGDFPRRRRWMFHLRRNCDVVTTSLRRLVARWVTSLSIQVTLHVHRVCD